MPKLPSLVLVALSFAATAALARGADAAPTGTPALPGCQGDCPAAGVAAMTFEQAALARPAQGTPRLRSISFAALASDPMYPDFEDLAERPAPAVLAFDEIGWQEPDAATGALALQSRAAAGTAMVPRAIPEPNIYALMLAGLAAGAWASRRRKR